MRLASFSLAGGPPRPGLIVGDEIVDLSDPVAGLPATMAELVALGPVGLERAARGTRRPGRSAMPLSAVRRHAPVPDPPAILAIGMNYRAHVAELGREPPEWQYWFNKQRTAIAGPGRPHRAADRVRHGRLRGRAGHGHRAALPARAGRPGPRGGGGLHHHQRRQRAGLAVAHADVHDGQVVRHPCALRSRAGDRRRGRRPRGAGDPHLGERRAAPGLDDGRHDLRLRRDDRVPDHGVPARAGHRHRHRDARRRRRRASTRLGSWPTGTPCGSRSKGSASCRTPSCREGRPGPSGSTEAARSAQPARLRSAWRAASPPGWP